MNHKQARWLALYVLCLGDLMIVLDTNIVNVALPSIQADLGFSQTALAWVVNAYMLTFGGFLLLSGRLGDLFGNKRVFLGGVVSFTAASIACGLAPSPLFLVVGRAGQGHGLLRVRGLRWWRGGCARRWRSDRPVQLALDLPGQRPDRGGRVA